MTISPKDTNSSLEEKALSLGLKKVAGVWLPGEDTHFATFLENPLSVVQGVGTYQFPILQAAVGLCKNRRAALDVGAHVGLWSMWLARVFETVYALEPVPILFEALGANVLPVARVFNTNVNGINSAAGAKDGRAVMRLNEPHSTGGYYIVDSKDKKEGDVDVFVQKIDSIVQYNQLDFIKIDVQGGEDGVIRGAEKTIRRNLPVICIEQREYLAGDSDAIGLLESWGYQIRRSFGSGDYIMTWGKP